MPSSPAPCPVPRPTPPLLPFLPPSFLTSHSGPQPCAQVVILAREAGLDLELQDVELQSLVPQPLQVGQPPVYTVHSTVCFHMS